MDIKSKNCFLLRARKHFVSDSHHLHIYLSFSLNLEQAKIRFLITKPGHTLPNQME